MQKDEILRVVETEAILFLKSMSETVESDISTILKWFISDTNSKKSEKFEFQKIFEISFFGSVLIFKNMVTKFFRNFNFLNF